MSWWSKLFKGVVKGGKATGKAASKGKTAAKANSARQAAARSASKNAARRKSAQRAASRNKKAAKKKARDEERARKRQKLINAGQATALPALMFMTSDVGRILLDGVMDGIPGVEDFGEWMEDTFEEAVDAAYAGFTVFFVVIFLIIIFMLVS